MDYIFPTLAGVTAIIVLFFSFRRPRIIDHIPTLGYSTPLLSLITAYKFRSHSREILEEGYRKYPNQVWKVYTTTGWFIIANGRHHIQDINKASDKELSMHMAFQALFQIDYTLGPEVVTNAYHANVVRSPMTRNFSAQFDDIYTVAVSALEEVMKIPSSSTDWHSIPLFQSIDEVLSRIFARLVVADPLCQNKAFQDSCRGSSPVLEQGLYLNFLPSFLKPIAAKFIINCGAHVGELAKQLQPIVAHRLNEQHLHRFDWPGKPNDALMLLMEEANKSGEEVTAYGMATRLYFISFATDTLAMMVACALHEVATKPEYLQPLRDEAEAVISQEGWNKDSISKLYKMDSFCREILRYYDQVIVHLGRRVVNDFVFSDGTLIPAGCDLYVNAYGIHYDEDLYPSARTFDAFRFVREDRAKQPSVNKLGVDYLPFGYGKEACPGRFIAAYEMKMILVYLITAYDIEADKELHATSGYQDTALIANRKAEIRVKRRLRKD